MHHDNHTDGETDGHIAANASKIEARCSAAVPQRKCNGSLKVLDDDIG